MSFLACRSAQTLFEPERLPFWPRFSYTYRIIFAKYIMVILLGNLRLFNRQSSPHLLHAISFDSNSIFKQALVTRHKVLELPHALQVPIFNFLHKRRSRQILFFKVSKLGKMLDVWKLGKRECLETWMYVCWIQPASKHFKPKMYFIFLINFPIHKKNPSIIKWLVKRELGLPRFQNSEI